MASLKAIRKRISTVKSTQKITRAMKMVAAARLTRAQARILALRPYAQKTQEMVFHLAAHSLAEAEERSEDAPPPPPLHPYLVERPEQTAAFLVLTSDRGLCGAFNTNINKAAERAWREREKAGQTVQLYTLGRKGRDYLRRRNAPIVRDFERVWDNLDLEKARSITWSVVPKLVSGEIDSIYLIYNEFKSAMSQKIVVEPLLPLRRRQNGETSENKREEAKAGEAKGEEPKVEYLFEPDKNALLERLVPMYVEVSIVRALLESMASELGARMTAMESATKNAKQIIERLTLTYNRARQAAITKELMEIIGGAEALKE